jgi:hypothetical protein
MIIPKKIGSQIDRLSQGNEVCILVLAVGGGGDQRAAPPMTYGMVRKKNRTIATPTSMANA